jgi:pilus assembly protein CpaB
MLLLPVLRRKGMITTVKKYKIMALVFAVLTGISIFLFFSAVEKSSQKDYVDVVVAAKEVDKRTALTAGMLTLEKMPAEAVHPDAARNIESVVGLITDGSLEKGEVILESKLLKTGNETGGLAYLVPEGMRAMTIPVDSVTGVAGLLKIGDKVDILAEFDLQKPQSVDKVPTSIMLLQDVEILATGSDASGGAGGTYTTVTLAVKSQDALKLNLAATSGKLRLTLRPPLDKGSYDYPPQTPDSLS